MTATEIDALAAPAGDGDVFVWRDGGALADLAARHRAARERYKYKLLDMPASELSGGDASGPLIVAAGHQPGFIHPGVWVKSAAVSALAARLGGRAEYWMVDSDAVHRTALAWPVVDEGLVSARSAAPFADSQAGWAFESLPARDATAWTAFYDRVPALWRAVDATAFSSWIKSFEAIESGPVAYARRWRAGIEAMDAVAGIPSPSYRLVSDEFNVCSASASLRGACFVGHLVGHAVQTAQAYNAALAAYRARRGIAGTQHPIPDLLIEGSRVEAPLWAVRDGQPRQRVYVSVSSGGDLTLWADGLRLGTVTIERLRSQTGAALCELAAGWNLRPRALALTMYLRLLASDVFIHGIGGAKYDQITDDVIRRLFGIEPPGYGCVTATLRLPLPRFDVSPRDLDRVHREGRDRRFNPQRLAARVASGNSGAVAELLDQRQRAIDASVRLRSESPRLRSERRAQYEAIHRTNQELARVLGLMNSAHANLPDESALAALALNRLKRELESNRVALNREWFVGLHAVDRLRVLAARAAEAVQRP